MSRTPDPRRRDRTRPFELIGLAAALALFVGVVVVFVTRAWAYPEAWVPALGFTGATFIVALVVLAMLLLAVGPISGGVDEDGPVDGDLKADEAASDAAPEPPVPDDPSAS